MKKNFKLFLNLKDERGVTAVIVGLSIFGLVSFGALAVDVGYFLGAKNELQNVADSAALHATGQLGQIYKGFGNDTAAIANYTASQSEFTGYANSVAVLNKAATKPISINSADVQIGKWETNINPPGLQEIGFAGPDAVRVRARRDTSINSPVSTFFARLFGTDNVDISAVATAALTGQSTIGEGELELPIGISKYWFETMEEQGGFCGADIKFYPTGDLDGCAGWHTYDDSPSNNAKLRDKVDGMVDGTFVPPEATTGGDEFEFVGGNLAASLSNLHDLFEAKKANDGDGDDTVWTTNVVVYESDDCSNPNELLPICGFAEVIIREVLYPEGDPSGQLIQAAVKCNGVVGGRGGGANLGTKGSIPSLVE